MGAFLYEAFMKVDLPHYAASPNKLLRYEEIDRKCHVGHPYVERVAIYLNKHKEECTATAQIIWELDDWPEEANNIVM